MGNRIKLLKLSQLEKLAEKDALVRAVVEHRGLKLPLSWPQELLVRGLAITVDAGRGIDAAKAGDIKKTLLRQQRDIRKMRRALLDCANVLYSLEKARDVIQLPSIVWKVIREKIESAEAALGLRKGS